MYHVTDLNALKHYRTTKLNIHRRWPSWSIPNILHGKRIRNLYVFTCTGYLHYYLSSPTGLHDSYTYVRRSIPRLRYNWAPVVTYPSGLLGIPLTNSRASSLNVSVLTDHPFAPGHKFGVHSNEKFMDYLESRVAQSYRAPFKNDQNWCKDKKCKEK